MKMWCLPKYGTCSYFMMVGHKALGTRKASTKLTFICSASNLPAEECFKLEKFPRNSFLIESSSCKILPWKTDFQQQAERLTTENKFGSSLNSLSRLSLLSSKACVQPLVLARWKRKAGSSLKLLNFFCLQMKEMTCRDVVKEVAKM